MVSTAWLILGNPFERVARPIGSMLCENKTDVYYFRLAITNTGRAAAHEVQVYISRVERFENGDYRNVDRFLPMALNWTHVGKLIKPSL